MDTFIDLSDILYNISAFFLSDFKQYMVMNKQNAGCSHIFGPLGSQPCQVSSKSVKVRGI